MLIGDLQDRLRDVARERIAGSELTGTELAKRAGLRQSHVSNFLNGRRSLSIESMDRVMEALLVQIHELLPETARNQQAQDMEFDCIPLVEPVALLHSDFGLDDIVDCEYFKKGLLRRMRPEMASQRESWQRFVLAKADKDSGAAMWPRLTAGAMLLIDRHYNSLRAYRRGIPNLYVVKWGAAFQVRYVELQGSQLTLRPESRNRALEHIPLGTGETFADYVVGRVAHISFEA